MDHRHALLRSIPACTGEPRASGPISRQRGVYPRVYGGTWQDPSHPGRSGGLSPRVRGNRRRGRREPDQQRSIPACTGEPPSSGPNGSSHWVYPRVYGGTGPIEVNQALSLGLSPRVRGNHVEPGREVRVLGSIPACTGEPPSSRRAAAATAVYPRVYGGTEAGRALAQEQAGLSPRVRGNLPGCGRNTLTGGSIPACTGEPLRMPSRTGMAAVYPRVYGGTR